MLINQLVEKWEEVLDNPQAPSIEDSTRRNVTARLLENQYIANRSGGEVLANLNEDADSSVPANVTGNVGKYDPILISMVRRSMPNLIAYDICGVQPMTGPTGLVFAMRPKYVNGGSLGNDAFYNEPDSDFSGTGTQAGTDPSVLNIDQDNSSDGLQSGTYSSGEGMSTSAAELLGTTGNDEFGEMGFEIEKISVEAKSRALKAEYSTELAQDLKNIHGLDAETELANILASEILAELNREVIRKIIITGVRGAQEADLTTAGLFDLDLDSNGRWSAEKFMGLMFQIERDANAVAKETRRGKANFIICSSNVASALMSAGQFTHAPNLGTDLQVDDAGNTFAGVLNGRYRVYVDPYTTGDFYTVGYKGQNQYDAGLMYCPYVPLQMYRAIGEDSFQPRIGFKTRYGMVANPFAEGATKGAGALTPHTNKFFRKVGVQNLFGASS